MRRRNCFRETWTGCRNGLNKATKAPGIRFSMAAIYAVQGNKEEALKWLQKAVDAGWRHYRYILRYPLFENIREDERFKKIIDDMKVKVAEMRRRVEQLEKDNSTSPNRQ